MITKKDLEKTRGLSHNTVTETLKACGLDTSKRSYTEQEITERFDVARRLIEEEGKSYQDVSDYFSNSPAKLGNASKAATNENMTDAASVTPEFFALVTEATAMPIAEAGVKIFFQDRLGPLINRLMGEEAGRWAATIREEKEQFTEDLKAIDIEALPGDAHPSDDQGPPPPAA